MSDPHNETGALEPVARLPQSVPQVTLDKVLDDPDKLRDFPIETVKELHAIAKEERDWQAKVMFTDAFNAVQRQMTTVPRRGWNPETRSHYPLSEDVDAMLDPLIREAGFGISFDTIDSPIQDFIRHRMTLSMGGYEREFYMDAPCDHTGPKGTPNKTKMHGMGSAMKYCRRRLKMNAFNIIDSEHPDDDGNAAGALEAKITDSQASELQTMLDETGAHEAFFDVYDTLDGDLRNMHPQSYKAARTMLASRLRRRT